MLIEQIAAASTRGKSDRVVLGAWMENGGYIQEALEKEGVFFDTSNDLWDLIEKSGVDTWLVNEQFLRTQLNAGIARIDVVDVLGEGSIFEMIRNRPQSFLAKELTFMIENAVGNGYSLVGNSWIKVR